MTQYAFSKRRQLIGLSLIGLLALAILLLVQAQTLTGLTIQLPAASSDTGSGVTSIDSLAGVHPADRKFFAPNDGVTVPADTSIRPADHKFFADGYVSDRNANAILLDDVHPADRKFLIGH